VWWDPKLAGQIVRAGRDRLLAYHVCDWLLPTRDLLNDRGMMGDGIIKLKKLRALVEAAGYTGHMEVEIFSDGGGPAPPTRCSIHAWRATRRWCERRLPGDSLSP
jgi:sugar phosphate isomerase/epimerase